MDMKLGLTDQLPEEWQEVSAVFVALGDAQRQRILLTFEPGQRRNVTQIAAASVLSRTAVSHHLKVLERAGVLHSRKSGKEVHFWVDKRHLESTLQRVLDYIKHYG